jgi:hypothetical protein
LLGGKPSEERCIEVGELLIKSLHQTLAAVAKSINQLGESFAAI